MLSAVSRCYFQEFTAVYRGGSCSAWYPYMDCCYLMRLFPYVSNGVYEIGDPCVRNFLHPYSLRMHTKCDMFAAGGGWTVIMQRNTSDSSGSSSVDFSSKGWDDYENGFGSLSGDFWFGLANLRCITQRETYELRVELTFADGSSGDIIYPDFQVDTRANGYKLTFGAPVGNATVNDAFARMTNFIFQTSDFVRSSTCKGKIEGGFWAPGNGACSIRTNLHASVAMWMGKQVYSASMMLRAVRCGNIRDCD
uniref:Tenascin-like protein n=1 Tax=Halisarca dujardinii TaxID=2583056 RepID=A0AA96S2Z4_HALDU|nr:tenascin-like protein [Halisarca dujardinii]